MERQATGITALDERIGGGLIRGTRNLIYGPPGSGKTVFAMQYLWEGLKQGETVSYDAFDRPWPHMRAYFESFGWDIKPSELNGKFIPIQAFKHFKPYRKDPRVRYFDLPDFDEMQKIDMELSKAGVSRFVAGDNYEHIFMEMSEDKWKSIEEWTINWARYDNMTNIDIMTEASERDPQTRRMMDYTLAVAHTIIRFRVREVDNRFQRELRVEKMEGSAHPMEWLPFEINGDGLQLV